MIQLHSMPRRKHSFFVYNIFNSLYLSSSLKIRLLTEDCALFYFIFYSLCFRLSQLKWFFKSEFSCNLTKSRNFLFSHEAVIYGHETKECNKVCWRLYIIYRSFKMCCGRPGVWSLEKYCWFFLHHTSTWTPLGSLWSKPCCFITSIGCPV